MDSGKFDFLVNNSGIGAVIPFAKATEADFDNAAVRNNPQMKAGPCTGKSREADGMGKIITLFCSEEWKWINGQRIEASERITLKYILSKYI